MVAAPATQHTAARPHRPGHPQDLRQVSGRVPTIFVFFARSHSGNSLIIALLCKVLLRPPLFVFVLSWNRWLFTSSNLHAIAREQAVNNTPRRKEFRARGEDEAQQQNEGGRKIDTERRFVVLACCCCVFMGFPDSLVLRRLVLRLRSIFLLQLLSCVVTHSACHPFTLPSFIRVEGATLRNAR